MVKIVYFANYSRFFPDLVLRIEYHFIIFIFLISIILNASGIFPTIMRFFSYENIITAVCFVVVVTSCVDYVKKQNEKPFKVGI